jgi:3D (Asp-Asp-Asp) domain-containing protein
MTWLQDIRIASGLARVARVAAVVGTASLLAGVGCASPTDAPEPIGDSHDELRVKSSFTSRGTGYYPSSSALEGGFVDRSGKKLRTLQQFLAGSAEYVSVAMDSSAFKYGTRLRIRELEEKYGRSITFRVVDTGGAFRGKGRTRIDVCTANRTASLDPTINGTLHIDVLDETAGPSDPVGSDDPPPPAPAPSEPPSTNPAPSTSGGSGRACTNDGACNTGNDGSGEICSSGRCVTGCHTNAQCPGNTTCRSGQCN